MEGNEDRALKECVLRSIFISGRLGEAVFCSMISKLRTEWCYTFLADSEKTKHVDNMD